MKELLQQVLRCLNSVPRFKFDNSDSYEMAKEIENALDRVSTQVVKIEIRGGVADVMEKPAGIEVEIFDHDNEQAEEGSGKATYESKELIEDTEAAKRGRKPTTGRYETRHELESEVLRIYHETSMNMSQISRVAQVSRSLVSKIIDNRLYSITTERKNCEKND